jgi:hypothetical protein
MDGNTSQNIPLFPDFLLTLILVSHVAKLSFGYGHGRFYLRNVFSEIDEFIFCVWNYIVGKKKATILSKRIKAESFSLLFAMIYRQIS